MSGHEIRRAHSENYIERVQKDVLIIIVADYYKQHSLFIPVTE